MTKLRQGKVSYSLKDIFDVLANARSFDEVLETILSVTMRELEADQGSILMLPAGGSGNESLQMLATVGLPEEIKKRGYVPRQGSISEYVLKERRPIIINDVPRTKHFETLAADTSRPRQIRSALCVPLMARGDVLGTMNINRTKSGRKEFEQTDLENCSIIAGQAAVAIQNHRLQFELQQNERLAAVGQTVAGISHCIKNILTGVKGGISLTQMGLDSKDDTMFATGFSMLKRNTGMLGNLVLDLLDYAKEREPARDWFEINSVFERLAEAVGYKADQASVRVVTQAANGLRFFGDEDQLFRALLNLANNAVEACANFNDDALVNINATLHDSLPDSLFSKHEGLPANCQWIKIQVSDNGPGIPPDRQQIMWGLFYSTKGSKGTGIGLPTTKKMIEEHSGFIRLHSEAGLGATFDIYLPCLQR